MSEELKPCPFCGDANPLAEVEVQGNMIYAYIVCHTCYHTGPKANTTYPFVWDKTIIAWNTRPIEDALTAERDAARAEVERLREALIQTKWRLDGNWTDELQAKYHSRKEAAIDCIRAALEVKP